MKITKRHRTGGRILALLMSCCMLSGVFPGTVTAADDTEKEALVLDKWVDKTEDGFKLTLESYATGSDETDHDRAGSSGYCSCAGRIRLHG